MADHNEKMTDAKSKSARGGYLSQAWLVLVLATCFGGVLAAVQITLGPIIAKNRENDARLQIPSLVPGAVADLTPDGVEVEVGPAGNPKYYKVYRAMKAGKPPEQIGWVIRARGPGYAANITLLLGLNKKGDEITGLGILTQSETPGLGNKIVTMDWRRQWYDRTSEDDFKAIPPTNYKKGNKNIKAITGATISSQSVCNIVNTTIGDFPKMLDKLKLKKESTPNAK